MWKRLCGSLPLGEEPLSGGGRSTFADALGSERRPSPAEFLDPEVQLSRLKDNETVGGKKGICLRDIETASHSY